MRRCDRAMKPDFAWYVFDKASHGVLAADTSYAIPVSPARINDLIYFHSAPTGKMKTLIAQNPNVSLVVVGDVRPSDHDFSTEYESGIFTGTVELVQDETEAIEAMRVISQRYTPSMMAQFEEKIAKSLANMVVYRLTPQEITAKRKKFDDHNKEIPGDYSEE